MSLFDSILNRLQKKITEQQSYKEVVISCVSDMFHITITPDVITLTRGVLIFQTNPAIKMALLLKKEALVRVLQEKGVSVTTIR